MNNKIPKYADRVVAFIDILGFGSIVRSLPTKPDLLANLHRVLLRIQDVEKSTINTWSITSDLEVSVFSDSIVLSCTDDKIISLISTAGWLQAELLYLGILTRGGVSIGPTIHHDGILFGAGMLTAYDLEQTAAIYPRIVIARALARKHELVLRRFVAIDSDSLTFIDPFQFDAAADGAEELAADGHDPRAIYFEKVRNHLSAGILAATEVSRPAELRRRPLAEPCLNLSIHTAPIARPPA